MSDSTLKQRLRNKNLVTGIGVDMKHTLQDLERILDKNPCDFLCIDSQHSAFNEDRLESFCRSAQSLQIPVIFRIKHTRHTYLIGNYLDLGPTGVLVPEVREEASVDEAIKTFYYPQFGKRSSGGSARWGIDAHPDRLAYAEWWNNTGILQVQLESIDAVVNCRKLGKNGVDAFTFGPNDLLYDIESYTDPPFKSVDECIEHVVSEMSGTDVAVGIGIQHPADREKYLDMGLTVLQTPMVV
ncbi:MAG: aldolase/citrate lyase family protein [Gemmatimonadota bacterium]|nr:aldolase/citrate lyase family protein [Gemmatimonadota bacterium]